MAAAVMITFLRQDDTNQSTKGGHFNHARRSRQQRNCS